MLCVRRQMERRSSALARHPERPDLCAHWRHRRGGDDIVAGKNRGRAQLGLSLLLAARCDLHAFRIDARGFCRGSAFVARMAPASNRRQSSANANSLRHARGTPFAGVRNRMAARLRKFQAGPNWQCRLESISARRLWRSDELDVSRPTGRHRNRGDGLGVAKSADEISRITLAGTGRRNLGSARRPQTFHPFENDGVAGVPSWRAIDRRGWAARERRARALEKNPRPNPSRSLRAWLQPESKSVYPVLWERRARRQLADGAADRIPPDRGRTDALYHRGNRTRFAGGWLRAALPAAGGKCGWFAWK